MQRCKINLPFLLKKDGQFSLPYIYKILEQIYDTHNLQKMNKNKVFFKLKKRIECNILAEENYNLPKQLHYVDQNVTGMLHLKYIYRRYRLETFI